MNYEIEQIVIAIANDKLDEQTGRALIGQMIDIAIQVRRATKNLYDGPSTPLGTVAPSPASDAPAAPTDAAVEATPAEAPVA